MDKERIHITPDDFIANIDEIPDGTEPRSRCKYYIRPYGPYGINEACEANYYVGNRVPYHEHTDGFETFLVDGGAIEVMTLGKKAAARKGDIVHITPYTPHSIHTLEDDSIWRAFHQGLWLADRMIDERALRDRHWDTAFDPAFRKAVAERHASVWFDYQFPECRDASASELPCLRPYDFSLADYSFEGISLMLKVGRWETRGVKEVWQLRLSTGYALSWNETHPFTHLYDVFSGSVRVTLEGMAALTAQTRDLLHIPRFLAGRIEALEDTVLLDIGCQGFLTRFMEDINAYKIKEPVRLKDAALVRELMNKNDYHVLFEKM